MRTKKNLFILSGLIFLFCFTLIGCSANTKKSASNAETNSDNFEEYQLRLRMFNDKYNTSYSFPNDDASIKWLLSLSPEQFEQYLTSVYDGSCHDTEKVMPKNDDVSLGNNEEIYIPNFSDKQ